MSNNDKASNRLGVEVTAENFGEFFPLDYPCHLIDALSGLSEDSAVVHTLAAWCERQGYVVSEHACRDVLESLIECGTHRGN